MTKPKGIRLIFWKVWGWYFNLKLKARFKQLEKRGHYSQKTVSNVTTKMLNKAAQDLYDGGAINDCQVYWNGAWIACEVKK